MGERCWVVSWPERGEHLPWPRCCGVGARYELWCGEKLEAYVEEFREGHCMFPAKRWHAWKHTGVWSRASRQSDLVVRIESEFPVRYPVSADERALDVTVDGVSHDAN